MEIVHVPLDEFAGAALQPETLYVVWVGDAPVGQHFTGAAVCPGAAKVALRSALRAWAALEGRPLSTRPAARSVTLAIYSRNEPDQLARCLKSVGQQKRLPDQVVVIDASKDTARGRDVALGFGAEYIRQDRPGLTTAWNAGARAARSEIVLYTTAAAVLHPRCVDQMAGAFSDEDVWTVAGLVLPAELATWTQRLVEGLWGTDRGFRRRDLTPDLYAALGPRALPAWGIGSGVATAVRRRAFEEVGYLDERHGGGEAELWARVLLHGGTCRYEPTAVAYQTYPRTLPRLWHHVRPKMKTQGSHATARGGSRPVRAGPQPLMDGDADRPTVGVVVPAYNAAATLDATLRSIRAQTYEQLDIVVVDDGSTDGTAQLARRHAAEDSRIRVVSQTNQGLAAARNRGIAECRTEFIAPVDADDLCHPEKFERQVRQFQRAGTACGLVYGWTAIIDVHGNMRGRPVPWMNEGDVFTDLLRTNFIGNGSSPMMRRAAILECGGYDADLHAKGAQGCEDTKLYLQIAERHDFAVVPMALTGYRVFTGTMSSNGYQMIVSRHLAMDYFTARYPEYGTLIRHGNFRLILYNMWRMLRGGQLGLAWSAYKYVVGRDASMALTVPLYVLVRALRPRTCVGLIRRLVRPRRPPQPFLGDDPIMARIS